MRSTLGVRTLGWQRVTLSDGLVWPTGAAMSHDGRYQSVCTRVDSPLGAGDVFGPYPGKVYRSGDFGKTWANTSGANNWKLICVSHTGQYQAVADDAGNVYESHDYGEVFSAVLSYSLAPVVTDLVISSTGQYQACLLAASDLSASVLWMSTNYGASWGIKLLAVGPKYSLAMSADGAKIGYTTGNNRFYYNLAYGVGAWSVVLAGTIVFTSVAVSADGSLWTATGTGAIHTSTDAANWTSQDAYSGIIGDHVFMSSDGAYQYLVPGVGGASDVLRSGDSGVNWASIYTGRASVAVSESGEVATFIDDSNATAYSADFGATFMRRGAFIRQPEASMANGIIAASADGKYQIATLTAGSASNDNPPKCNIFTNRRFGKYGY